MNIHGRIYPSGSSSGFSVRVDVEGESLVASDGTNTAKWSANELKLKLGGCAEDRIVISCPTGDTIISTNFDVLAQLANCGPAIGLEVKKTKRQKESADWRRRFSFAGVGLVWLGPLGCMVFLGILVTTLSIVAALMDTKEGSQTPTEQTQTATTTESAETDKAEELRKRYEEFAQGHVKKKWHPGKYKKAFKTVASFVVDGEGQVSDFEIQEASGNAKFDAAVEAAVDQAQPFPAPPEGESLEVIYDFTNKDVKAHVEPEE